MRKKTFMAMTVISAVYLILWSVLLYYYKNNPEAARMDTRFLSVASALITQMGLQFSSMLLCLIAVMLGAGVIATELETGMVHAILSRPIRRFEYVLGKLAGLFILVVIYASVLFFALLCIGGVFSLETVVTLSLPRALSGWLVYVSVPLAVLCLTVYGSVSFKTVPCGLLMITVYLLGNIGGMVEMIGQYIGNDSVTAAGIFLSLVSPFHTLYTTAERLLIPANNLMNEMMRGAGGLSGSGRPPSIWMFVYIGVYAAFFVAMAVRKFERRDIA
jgi:ABC-type transport system involved in multi-copper enzyme maturation permease subunit